MGLNSDLETQVLCVHPHLIHVYSSRGSENIGIHPRLGHKPVPHWKQRCLKPLPPQCWRKPALAEWHRFMLHAYTLCSHTSERQGRWSSSRSTVFSYDICIAVLAPVSLLTAVSRLPLQSLTSGLALSASTHPSRLKSFRCWETPWVSERARLLDLGALLLS